MLKQLAAAEKVLVSSGFFDPIITDVINLVNEEFRKLRIKTISRDNLILFFDDATAGMSIDNVKLSKSKKNILNKRLIKIAFEIAEKHCIKGFRLIVS